MASDPQDRVDAAFKKTIESELSRASSSAAESSRVAEEAAPFSRGVIFSRTSPFSRGIFFSRASSGILEQAEDPELLADEAAMKAFAERVAVLQQIKDAKTSK